MLQLDLDKSGIMMALFNRTCLILSASRPLAWVIAPAIWFSGLVHSSASAQSTAGVLFAVALTFPTCLGEAISSIHDHC